MKVLEIEYGETKNMGNYESRSLKYRVAVEDTQTADECLDKLKDKVRHEMEIITNEYRRNR